MVVIGIAGGIASGKSSVASQLEQCGAAVLDADRAGHDVLLEAEVEQRLRERWGNDVFTADGKIDRTAVGRIVFAAPPAGPPELAFLERVTHPRIEQRLRRQLSALATQHVPAAVLDAPVMFEAGWDQLCDTILFVDAPRETRLARALHRGWDESQFEAREAIQRPVEWKRRRADVVIDNSGPPEQTRQQVRQFWNSII